MYTGKVLAWNPDTGRGIVVGRLTNQTYQFEADDITTTTDLMDIRSGVDVFFAKKGKKAFHIELIISSFNRFRDNEEKTEA